MTSTSQRRPRITASTAPEFKRPVLIVDYGSQYTQLIARRVRELGAFSLIVPGNITVDRIQALNPRAVVLSGGPSSVYEAGAPKLPDGFLEYQKKSCLPVLGICYGMHLLARDLGGVVERGQIREYGRTEIQGENGSSWRVWMSHGDEVKELPPGFSCDYRTHSGLIASMRDDLRKFYALQFHPEVTHSENGIEFIKEFLFKSAGVKPAWSMKGVLSDQIDKIRAQVGPSAHVLCALSGGVDSLVAATLVGQAIGDRLRCFFVDHGLMRFEEGDRIMSAFEKTHLDVRRIDASDRFLSKLAGVEDPETKRKMIGAEFISVFEDAAQGISREVGHLPEFLVQGTLYPDVIESSPGHGHSVTIKSHHNVGGLPKDLRFQLIEPLRDLFKDEVRELGRQLGIAEEYLMRHPFPGPGLAVRVIGEVTQERLEILRKVDEIFIQNLKKEGLYGEIWQAFAVFLPIRTVGVQGDGRTHDHVVALRAVTSSDGMTADWYAFDPHFLARVSSRICNEVRGVSRVVYDISSKPPATIEWE